MGDESAEVNSMLNYSDILNPYLPWSCHWLSAWRLHRRFLVHHFLPLSLRL
jgi:hypothetical protein